MTSPPDPAPTSDDRPPVSGGDAYLALLIREARAVHPELRRFGKRDLLRMAREFAVARELDLRDREARRAAVDVFGDWLRSNYWPSITRRGAPVLAPSWRTHT